MGETTSARSQSSNRADQAFPERDSDSLAELATPAPEKSPARDLREPALLIGNFLCGCVLALSAPGFDQWYLAWFAVSPLLVSCFVGPSALSVFRRGLCFGAGYYAVYCNWMLAIHPLDWLGMENACSLLMVVGGWIFLVASQASNVALFAVICRLLPLRKMWYLAPLLIPPLWMLCVNRLGNAHLLFGLHSDLLNRWSIPWGVLEYSQYRQDAILQLTPLTGGIGLCFLIVMVNTLIAMVAITFIRPANNGHDEKSSHFPMVQVCFAAIYSLLFAFGSSLIALAALAVYRLRRGKLTVASRPNRTIAITLLILTMGCIAASIVMASKMVPYSCHAYSPVTILQANDKFRVRSRFRPDPMIGQVIPFLKMVENCPPGLCVGSETALPLPIGTAIPIREKLSEVALKHNNDICVGCFERDETGNKYNSVCGIDASGKFLPELHQKRYLVPFLEYTPNFFQPLRTAMRFPETWSSFRHGTKATVLQMSCGKVAPVICFEIVSPELCAASAKNGGELLICLADQAWFRNSMIGNQMIAFCVMRAVENRRYVVFSSNTGPSAIVDPQGKIQRWSSVGKKQLVLDNVGFNSELTPFCKWITQLGRL